MKIKNILLIPMVSLILVGAGCATADDDFPVVNAVDMPFETSYYVCEDPNTGERVYQSSYFDNDVTRAVFYNADGYSMERKEQTDTSAENPFTTRTVVENCVRTTEEYFNSKIIEMPADEITEEAGEVIEELEAETLPEVEREVVDERVDAPVQTETILYRGYYFDVQYPEYFSALPTEPTTEFNGLTYHQTDEASFTSPDGDVEFFIYSPLWGGDPEGYLEVRPNETLVSEKVEESGEGDTRQEITWVTVKAIDGSYHRSWVSIKEDNSGSQLHHVFGIQYKDKESYDRYRDDYIAFKNSLRQYAD